MNKKLYLLIKIMEELSKFHNTILFRLNLVLLFFLLKLLKVICIKILFNSFLSRTSPLWNCLQASSFLFKQNIQISIIFCLHRSSFFLLGKFTLLSNILLRLRGVITLFTVKVLEQILFLYVPVILNTWMLLV